MPNRILRESINDSDLVNQLDWPEEVFYRRLMSKVDDFGLFDARPATLKSALFPLREAVRTTDITRWLAACEKAGVLACYESDSKPFLAFYRLGDARAKRPRFPIPPADIIAKMPADDRRRFHVLADEIKREQTHADVTYSDSLSDAHSNSKIPPNPPSGGNGVNGDRSKRQTRHERVMSEGRKIAAKSKQIQSDRRQS